MTVRYPNIQAIYIDRARAAQRRKIIPFLIGLVLVILVLFTGFPQNKDYHAHMFFALVLSGYCFAKIVSIGYGLRHFDRLWEKELNKAITTDESRALFEEVEKELAEPHDHFEKVIFTENYLVAFDRLGAFALIKDVTAVYLDHPDVHRNPFHSPFDGQKHYELNVKTKDLGSVTLSRKYDEMPYIVNIILDYNPDVFLDREALDHFFPLGS